MNVAALTSIFSIEISSSYLTYLLTFTVSASLSFLQIYHSHLGHVLRQLVEHTSYSRTTWTVKSREIFRHKLPPTSPDKSKHPAGRTAPPHEQSIQASRHDRIHFSLKVIDAVPRAERNCRQRNQPPLRRRRLGLSTPVAGLHLPTQ